MMSVSLREPYLFDLPIGASASGYLSQRIYPNWDERRGGGSFSLGRQFGTSIYSDVSDARRRSRLLRLPIAGSRQLPGRQRLHVVVLAQAELAARQSPVRQPQQPVHGHQGPVPAALDRTRLGAASPGPSSTRRAESIFRPAAARTAPASNSSPSEATSGSRPSRRRSMSDTSRATSAACADFSIERSVLTSSTSRPAAS